MLVRIQQHKSRDELVRERLLPGLEGLDVEHSYHESVLPNPWLGYRAALENLPATGHVLVLQDDVIVSKNFTPAVELIAAANPDTVVSLYLSTVPKRTLNSARLHWGRSRYVDTHPNDLVHVIAVLWPVDKARDLLAWVDENPLRLQGTVFQSDDATLTRWKQFRKERVRVTIPNLVQHPDDVESIVNGHRAHSGADKGRVSAAWIGAGDPLELDWSK